MVGSLLAPEDLVRPGTWLEAVALFTAYRLIDRYLRRRDMLPVLERKEAESLREEVHGLREQWIDAQNTIIQFQAKYESVLEEMIVVRRELAAEQQVNAQRAVEIGQLREALATSERLREEMALDLAAVKAENVEQAALIRQMREGARRPARRSGV